MDQYSASVDEREMVCCFLVFQETGEPPKETKYLVIERLVIGQLEHNHNKPSKEEENQPVT